MPESRQADRPASFWEPVGIDYAGNELTLLQIYAKYGITKGEFDYAKKQLGWARRNAPQANRETIIRRLFRLLDRMLETLETEMTSVSETEVNVLGKLVQSMGKLIEIETATNSKTTARQTRDMHDIRRKLVDRIAELKRG